MEVNGRLNVVPYSMEDKGIRLKTEDWKLDFHKKINSFKPDLLAISSTEDMWIRNESFRRG